ncbi:MAG TPA: FtsX-like permease family protein [Acidimicrobiia bacterium]|nr:FtsX-like permease family protein [Acidimicrobiia bacterium]
MLKTSLRSVWHRRRRVLGICVAVTIGVAFLTGTLVLGDTLKTNFDRLFAETSAGTSVVVRNATAVQSDRQFDADRGLVDEALVARVRAVPGVADAQGQVAGYGLLIGRDGSAVGGNGPPRMAGSWITDPVLNPYRLVQGRAPAAPDEVVINRGAAKSGDLHVGDTATVQTPEPITVRIVGIATFGDADGFGQATFTAFTLPSAQTNVTHQPGRVSSIVVRADRGVSATTLRARVSRVLPRGVQAITGQQLTNERIDRVSSAFLDMLRAFLVVFAAIALVVAALSINNTFSITVAQRTRELALMRAVGASRRQVRAIVTFEALAIGGVSALVGLVAGLGVAGLLKGMFDAFGFALPAGGLAVRTSSLAIAFVAGVLATLLASQLPARRASSVAPVAALAESSAEAPGIGGGRTIAGGALAAAGVAGAVAGALGGSITLAGPAALVLVVGSLMLAPVALGPVSHAIGAVLGRLRPTSASFAEQNARRNPRRTTATVTALVVGVAVVSLFTLFVASLKATLDQQVQTGLRADLVLSSPSFGGGRLSPSVATDVARSPVVTRAVGLGEATFLLDGKTTTASVADTTQIGRVMRFDTVAGSVPRVSPDGIAVSRSEASAHGWHVGSRVELTFGGGAREQATVRAVYDHADLLDDVLVPSSLWARHTAQPTDTVVFVSTRPGVSFAAAKRALDPVATHNGATVQDLSQYASSSSAGLNTMLGIVYVMLALAVLIALLGIANTLSLAVYERRRELGLLRAVGQTRAQLRSVLRFESLITSTFGTVLGLLLGGFLGWVFAVVSGAGTFSLPVVQLAVVAVLGAVAGVLAAVRPARRAARLPVLESIGAL